MTVPGSVMMPDPTTRLDCFIGNQLVCPRRLGQRESFHTLSTGLSGRAVGKAGGRIGRLVAPARLDASLRASD